MKQEACGVWRAAVAIEKRYRIAVLVAALAGLAAPAGDAAELKLAKEKARVDIQVQRSKSTRVKGGDWDDKLEKVSVEVKIRNLELNRSIEGLVARYWVFAEAINDSKAYKVILSGSFPVNLTSTPDGREAVHESNGTSLRWDNTFVTFGQRYEGWLVVVTNAAGEVVACRSSKASWEQNFAKAGNLKNGKFYTATLDPTKGPPS